MSRTFRNSDDPAFVTLLSAGRGNGHRLDLCVYTQQISNVDLDTAEALRDAITEALHAADPERWPAGARGSLCEHCGRHAVNSEAPPYCVECKRYAAPVTVTP